MRINLTIKKKLTLSFGVVFVLIVIGFLNSERTFATLTQHAEETISVESPYINSVIDVKYLVTKGHLWFEEIMGGDENEEMQTVYDLWGNATRYCDAILEGGTVGKVSLVATDDPILRKQILALRSEIQRLIEVGQVRYEGGEGIGSNMDQEFDTVFEGVMVFAEDVEETVRQRMEHRTTEMNQKGNQARLVSTIVFLCVLGVSILVSWLFGRSISTGIGQLVKATERVSEGDYSYRVQRLSSDEVGMLGDAFNEMAENTLQLMKRIESEKDGIEQRVNQAVKESEAQRNYLSQSIDAILKGMARFATGDLTVRLDVERNDEIGRLFEGFNKAVTKVHQMIQEVHGAVASTANEAQQISSATSELATGIQNQSDQAIAVASAVEEMLQTILVNAESASAAARVTREGGDIAENGGQVVQQTIDKIEQLANVVKTSASTVERLGESSSQIDEIVSVISEIADQTNLLALNAAIEAARAGEQGKGFAVVADEVRKLAERTTSATREISGKIQRIQQDTRDTVESIQRGTTRVEEGIMLADKAGTALRQVVEKVREAVFMAENIASATDQQSSTSTVIAEKIDAISNVSQESAYRTTRIAESTNQLKGLTDQLNRLIATFVIDRKTVRTHVETIN